MNQLKEILLTNKKWAAGKLSSDREYFKKLAKGQNPEILYIGCSDSRVTVEEFMGLKPGEVFVHRNVANLVILTDVNVNAVIQYAVENLKVKHIIVCGHYECGGVKAAMHPKDMGQLNSWLQSLRDVIRFRQTDLNKITDQRRRFDRLVELNVIEQCINIIKIDHFQRSWSKNRYPMIHGWVFNVRNGLLKDLKVNMKEELRDIRSIYDLKLI